MSGPGDLWGRLAGRGWIVGVTVGVTAVVVAAAVILSSGDDAVDSSTTAGSPTSQAADAPDDATDDDQSVLADAGQVVQYGGGTPPAPGQPAPVAPGFAPATIQSVAQTNEADPPAPLPIPELAGPVGGLTSNAVGCAADCIVSALIQSQDHQAEVGFTITTNVAATTTVWMSQGQIVFIGTTPTIPGADPIAGSGTPRTTWATELGPLSYATTYHVIVEVEDQYGNSRFAVTQYRTIDDPLVVGDEAGSVGGCAIGCIASGTVFPTESYDTVRLVVTTSVPVSFSIAVSPQEPGYVGESPILPADETFEVEQDSGTAIGGQVVGLQPDTTYHVVVKATDQNGYTDHAVGQFHTAPLPPRVPPAPTHVLVSFERVTIVEDGDPVGRGEIRVAWGFGDGSYTAVRLTERVDSGSTITFPDDSGVWIPVWPGGSFPDIIVNVTEEDRGGNCAAGTGVILHDDDWEDPNCAIRTVVGVAPAIPLSFLDSMTRCSDFFPVAFGEDRPCLEISSSQILGNTWPAFRAIVSFTVWDGS